MIKPIAYFGGRYSFIEDFNKVLNTPHKHFVDVYGGSGSITLNIPPSEKMTFNDRDHGITSLMKVLKEHGRLFQKEIALTPFGRLIFDNSKEYLDSLDYSDDFKSAMSFFIVAIQSFNRNQSSWYRTTGELNNIRDYLIHIKNKLPGIVKKLESIPLEVRCESGIDLIDELDEEGVLFLVDPPHWDKDASENYTVYRHSMKRRDYVDLIERLSICKAKVCISFNAKPSGEPDLFRNNLEGFKLAASWNKLRVYEEEIYTNY